MENVSKFIALACLLLAMCRLYRILFPKHPKKEEEKDSDVPEKKEIDTCEAVIKSRFVPHHPRQPQTTDPTPLKTGFQAEKQHIFVTGNENRTPVIPVDRLDKAFETEKDDPDPDPESLDIDDEDSENDEPDRDEEAEDFYENVSPDAELSGGFSIEELIETVKASDNPTAKDASLLYRVEKTDMFEKLVSGDEGKLDRIRVILDSFEKSFFLKEEPEKDKGSRDGEGKWENFDIRNYLVKKSNVNH